MLCSLYPLGLVTMATSRQPSQEHVSVWVGSSTVTEEKYAAVRKKNTAGFELKVTA